jgi:hypothetical protein
MSLVNQFIEAGFESDLYSAETKALNLCSGVIEYIDKHHKFPAITDESPYVRKLANWLTSMRAAHNNKSKRVIYPSVIKMVNDSKYPELFNITKLRGKAKATMNSDEYYSHRESKSIKQWDELIGFIKTYHMYPIRIYPARRDQYHESFYSTSNRLFNWMSSMRRSNHNKGTRVLYPALIKTVSESEYPNIFNSNWMDDFNR